MKRPDSIIAILALGARSADSLVGQTAAICSGTEQSRQAHAGALLDDGGPMSVATGATLLGQLEAGCEA